MTSNALTEWLAVVGPGVVGWAARMTLATGVVLLGALAVDQVAGRRLAAGVRGALFGAVLLRALLPVGLVSPIGLLGGRAPAATSAIELGAATVVSAGAAGPAHADRGLWWSVGYAAVAFGLLVGWLSARLRLRRALRTAVPFWETDSEVPVWTHETLGPMLAGVWRPRVVLPRVLAEGPADALACVLLHERAHLARRDHLTAPLLQLLCIFMWPIVPLWIAARRMRTLCEMACDERALADKPREMRRRYGEVLLALAEGRPPVRGSVLLPSFAADLRARLRALPPRKRFAAWTQGLLVVGAAGALIACSGAAASEREPAADTQANAPTPAGRRAQAPNVVPGMAKVDEGLSHEAIRVVVRQHINEIKFCYELSRADSPSRGGRVVVHFVISPEGNVTDSQIESSTLGHAKAEACIALSHRRWEFPKPDNGKPVQVSYPYAFSPADEARAEETPKGAQPVVLTVTKDGAYLVNDKPVDSANLLQELRNAREASGINELFLRVRTNGPLGKPTVDALRIGKSAGFQDFHMLGDNSRGESFGVTPRPAPSAGPHDGSEGTSGTTPAVGPRVERGQPAVQGNLAPEIVARTVRGHLNETKACYEAALATQRKLSGQVQLTFTVGSDGVVKKAAVSKSTIGNAQVEQCLKTAVMRWEFPKPFGGGEAEVTVPFTLQGGP